ncbi:MAG: transporter substrate-binding domain-containing protein [Candidatus Heteroscillospira sp.]|jgi:polar amino acid transport system substrate-binding protein
MKKNLALLLALVMCLGMFTACGSSDDKTPSSATDVPQTPPASNTDVPEESEAPEAESDMDYVKANGKLIVGITNFEPMDYKAEGSDEWVGFDADMARLFAESLGVDAEFVEITWDYKVMELDSKNIDCVWNGMTLNDEVKAAMSVTDPYCLNAQVLVMPEGVDFEAVFEGLNIAVESGSAGEDAAIALGATTIPLQAQSNALMEVAAGTADAAAIDLLMAGAMIGEGTSYEDLTIVMNLNEAQNLESEEYGVGFRKGSDLVDAFNEFLAEKVADGTVMEIAKTYGLQEAVIVD